MSFLNGFIANEIDEKGNSNVARIVWTQRKELLYSIDSESVEDLYLLQGRKQLSSTVEAVGGKTFVKFKAKPERWLGMIYSRIGFVLRDAGDWSYTDFWYIPSETSFMLVLPPYAVVESCNVSGFQKFDLDNQLVMSQFFSGGDLQIDLKYRIDSQQFVAQKYPILESSSFPYAGSISVLEQYQSDSERTRKALKALGSSIEWVAKGAAIIKAAEILGFL